VSAVIVNVTVTQPETSGIIVVYPTGQSRPVASNLNYLRAQTVPNLVVAKVAADGTIQLYSSANTHLVADVVGYFPSGSEFTSLSPSRLLDTRAGIGRPGTAKVTGGTAVTLDVTGVGGVPASGVSAVIVNVTVTQPETSGIIVVYPTGQSRPVASNLNYLRAQTVPNLVVAKVAADGTIQLYSSANTHLVADVVGYFPSP
jgi:hypothetical protein